MNRRLAVIRELHISDAHAPCSAVSRFSPQQRDPENVEHGACARPAPFDSRLSSALDAMLSLAESTSPTAHAARAVLARLQRWVP